MSLVPQICAAIRLMNGLLCSLARQQLVSENTKCILMSSRVVPRRTRAAGRDRATRDLSSSPAVPVEPGDRQHKASFFT